IAAFAHESLHIALVGLKGVGDAAVGELRHGDADGEHFLGAGRRSEAASGFEAGHEDAEISPEFEPGLAERTEHLVLRFFEEPEEVPEPDDACGVGVGPMDTNVYTE